MTARHSPLSEVNASLTAAVDACRSLVARSDTGDSLRAELFAALARSPARAEVSQRLTELAHELSRHSEFAAGLAERAVALNADAVARIICGRADLFRQVRRSSGSSVHCKKRRGMTRAVACGGSACGLAAIEALASSDCARTAACSWRRRLDVGDGGGSLRRCCSNLSRMPTA